jgi:hypothetical protein
MEMRAAGKRGCRMISLVLSGVLYWPSSDSCSSLWQDPASPLDVTKYIQPGPNVIRFIQLASMIDHTFILHASRREPPSDAVSQIFENAGPIQSGNSLFNFDATVTVS